MRSMPKGRPALGSARLRGFRVLIDLSQHPEPLVRRQQRKSAAGYGGSAHRRAAPRSGRALSGDTRSCIGMGQAQFTERFRDHR